MSGQDLAGNLAGLNGVSMKEINRYMGCVLTALRGDQGYNVGLQSMCAVRIWVVTCSRPRSMRDYPPTR